jgi:2-oxoglutarate ferredoxin oxidoreductase subunit alpha
VSNFQLNFSAYDIHTPGDRPQVLVAMNPAALKANIKDVEPGGTVIINSDAFVAKNFKTANLTDDPRSDGTLNGFSVHEVPVTSLTLKAVESTGLTNRQATLCKNMFTLGVTCWLYDRSLSSVLERIDAKFAAKMPEVSAANQLALKAGYHFGETAEFFSSRYRVSKAPLAPGRYRRISGNQACALGFVAAAQLSGRPLFYGSYPITPASDILHELARLRHYDVRTFQAEDEISAIGAAIGAAFGGALGLTGTSGPGVALKSEAIGLAVMTELPVVIANIQRGGPSTGLPTKTEQADLLQAMFGRNGECPVPIVAPATPSECFTMAIEAVRIAFKYMTPVFFLSDGYLANGSEPWLVPEFDELEPIEVEFATEGSDYQPYRRDPETLARQWALPGTPGLEHRIGGIEKEDITGNVNYEPENHEHMVHLRNNKVEGIAKDIPELEVTGPEKGELLVIGWGGTAGAIKTAVERAQRRGVSVAHAHLRYLNPFPANLEKVLNSYKQVLIPELNLGQLLMLIRARFLVDAVGLNKVQAQPFRTSEIEEKIDELVGGNVHKLSA